MKKYKLLLTFTLITVLGCESDKLSDQLLENSNLKSGIYQNSNAIRLPIDVSEDFIWGINGHPTVFDGYDYENNIPLQVDLLKEHQLDYYRINLRMAPSGAPLESERLNELLQEIQGTDIKLLPVLMVIHHINFNNPTLGENYNKGKNQAITFANSTANVFDHYSIGNELNLDALISPYTGDEPHHYDINKITQIAAYLKGMNDGFHQVSSQNKTMVVTGWVHFAYLHHLLDRGVDFDIIAYHLYTGDAREGKLVDPPNTPGNRIMDSLLTFNKDIWITEIGRKKGSSTPEEQISQRDIINEFIDQIDGRNYYQTGGTSRVKAFFIYELFDEHLLHGDNIEGEGYYGIMDYLPFYGYDYKLVAGQYKLRIEETKNGYEDYIYRLYEKINLREPYQNPIEPGYTYWVNQLKDYENVEPIDVISSIMHDEGYLRFAEYQIDYLINNSLHPHDASFYEGQMQNNQLSREDLIVELCKSNAFWLKSQQNNTGFVTRLYDKLLERTPDPEGLSYYVDLLNNGTSREAVIVNIMESEEYIRKFIKDQYLFLLERESDPVGEDYWYNLMINGLNQEGVIKGFIDGKEFWKQSIISGYERNNFPYSFYN